MRNRWLRALAYIVGGALAIVLLFVLVVKVRTSSRMAKTYDVALVDVAAPSDSASIARGAHLVHAITKCADCHGSDLGGRVFIDDPSLGRLIAPNLTPGGSVAQFTNAEIARAIWHGVGRDGRGLRVMPSSDFQALSVADVGAIIAYLRELPKIARKMPPSQLTFLADALWTTGQLPLMNADDLDHHRPHVASVVPSTGVAYGHYLADIGGCTGCHGATLSGGKIPGTPPDWKPAANLTPTGIGTWTDADFVRALREGRRPNGTPIDTIMPWRSAGMMTGDEITAVHTYLRTVPPRAFGNH